MNVMRQSGSGMLKMAWMSWAIALLALVMLFLGGCSVNYRKTNIAFEQNAETGATAAMTTDASGATNTTDTDQDANGDFSGVLEAAKEWADETLAGALEKFKIPDLKLPEVNPVDPVQPAPPVDPVDPVTPDPAQPPVEEID